ncbi:hypothetical protein Sjap_005430 [Stephania japonica]|uniref:Uncharacterized protein n=1 Tax=Stephania japonica TaxID=461633 RepID=A0AAP0K435_9MAGN
MQFAPILPLPLSLSLCACVSMGLRILILLSAIVVLPVKSLKPSSSLPPPQIEDLSNDLSNEAIPTNPLIDLLHQPSIAPTPTPPPPPPLVPALFVLGDSSVDCGNNNYLPTFAHANFPPYGRDFDTEQPTGRFCNGRIPVDFLALRLGLPFVPAFLGQQGRVEDMIRGVNYASAGAGIILSSGSELGQHISLIQQIQQVKDTFQQFILSMGEEEANDFISKSIFYLSIGSNDYIHYYLRNVSRVQSLYKPWEFNELLVSTVKLAIKNLYNANVKKMVVTGLAPLGCSPRYLWQYNSKNGECITSINDIAMEFNFGMRYMIEKLGEELVDAQITFCDLFQASMDILQNRKLYGFEVTTDACCGFGPFKGWLICLLPSMACPNASNHVWWDQFHPTEAVNAILADNIWSGLHMDICYPMNLKEMVVPEVKVPT